MELAVVWGISKGEALAHSRAELWETCACGYEDLLEVFL